MTINYPNGMKNKKPSNPKSSKPKTFSNRGMNFESYINQSNDYYLEKGIAVIHKKPTPVQIVQVNYPKRSAAVITEAYFKEASTTDYNGIYKGYYLDFEAKETKNKTSFPINNMHDHQIKHMKQCLKQGGIVFILIWFSTLKRCFYLPSDVMIDFVENTHIHGKKSMPLDMIESTGYEIPISAYPVIAYLSIIDQYILKGDSHDETRAWRQT